MGQRFRGAVERAANVARGLYTNMATRRARMRDARIAFQRRSAGGMGG